MLEEEVSICSDGALLAGSVCIPDGNGPFPAVLMIHGSGPLDRNENVKGQRLDVFNTLAQHLADKGIASLRYDKRGCGSSTGDYYTAGHHDLVRDAIACFDALAESRHFDATKRFALGHSEGCIIAPQVSALRPDCIGLILLCPFIEKMESILIRQAAQLERELKERSFLFRLGNGMLPRILGASTATQQRLIDRVKSTKMDSIRIRFRKLPAKWMRELLELDMRPIFRANTAPMLLIGGAKDLQCEPSDIDQIAEVTARPADTHVFPNLTHILRYDELEPSLLESKRLLKKPVEPDVLEMITAWILAETKRAS